MHQSLHYHRGKKSTGRLLLGHVRQQHVDHDRARELEHRIDAVEYDRRVRALMAADSSTIHSDDTYCSIECKLDCTVHMGGTRKLFWCKWNLSTASY